MVLVLSSLVAGLLFGLGLVISQMVNPAKVLAFLDIFGSWDPSLALVMGAAVAVSALGYAVAKHRGRPVLAPRLEIPTRRDLDPRLLAGAAIFGVGWGLAGLCPGPALTLLPLALPKAFLFVAAMLAGMVLFRFVPEGWPQSTFRRETRPVEMMPDATTSLLAAGSGSIVGLVLGLVGGGGSILAVPLLVYVVGVSSPHVAIGTSALAVSVSALGNVGPHWRAGHVKWRCAAVFAGAGVLGAAAGSIAAKALDGEKLLALFGIVMIIVGGLMLREREATGDPDVRLTSETARELLPLLLGIGFGVGLFSGFFGIGGGFLIVPGLILATGMPLIFAIGTSLVAVAAFGAATAASYAISGLIDWPLAALFVVGGIAGGVAGVSLGKALATRKQALSRVFAILVIAVGLYIVSRGVIALTA